MYYENSQRFTSILCEIILTCICMMQVNVPCYQKYGNYVKTFISRFVVHFPYVERTTFYFVRLCYLNAQV